MYLSLIIDGMDQYLPHFTGRQAKIINPAVLLKTHVTGVISHGHGHFRSFVDVLEYPHDPNLTINILAKTIIEIVDKQVHMSFLYSSHTHEDIDAAFSKIAQLLRHYEAETLDELIELIPNSKRLSNMYDYKNWLYPSLTNVKGTREALHYKIKKDGQKAVIFYKGQQHTDWLKMDGVGSFLKTVPKGNPKALKPVFSRITDNKDRLSKQIEEIPFLFSNIENIGWWDDFLKNPSVGQCPRQRHLSNIPKQNNQQSQVAEVVISEELQRLLDKESAVPKVVCEKKKVGQKRKR